MRNQTQLELGLAEGCKTPQVRQRQPQLSRAQWWFRKMREVTEHAMEWEPAPRFQHQQTWFAGSHHQN